MSASVTCPIWSLYADWHERESKGQRILFRPTHDEIALTHILGRDSEVGRNARRTIAKNRGSPLPSDFQHESSSFEPSIG
jgi:hypothetical protein